MIRPLGTRLLLEQDDKKEFVSAAGIILGEERIPQAVRAKVVAVGANCTQVKVGDLVFVSQFAPTEVKEKPSDKTMVCPEEDVLAVIDPEEAAK